ncbi:SEL1-like repeat protein [Candidatus Paracaedibacter symbiosus]|uniref:SEL1-like repeat protein n=1 Tax=Candidatus Paracaedibacter symbiosus TaxID=244582 RepID=UPI00068F1D37|nr:SEL1-like repeat protein [Candidatus Paracaedibacter symbiosus]
MPFHHPLANTLKKIFNWCRTLIAFMILSSLSAEAMDHPEMYDLRQHQGAGQKKPEYVPKTEPFVKGTLKFKYTFSYQPQQASLQKDTPRQEKPPPIPYVVQDALVAKVIEEEPKATKQSGSSTLDHRYQVQDPSQWPYCVHGHLMMGFGEEEKVVGSGILVGPNHVLTAGHNLYRYDLAKKSSQPEKGWPQEVWFSPGRQGENFPFGYSKGCILLCPKEWITNSRQKDAYDFGMVILDKAIGNKTGWSGLLYAPDIFFKKWEIMVTGYPGEKGSKDYYSTQMWEMQNRSEDRWFDPEKIFYRIDTSFGQSGGAIWRQWPSPISPEQNSVFTIGIHTDGSINGNNSGVRITKDKFARIVDWIKTYHLEDALPYSIPEPMVRPIAGMKEPKSADEWWNEGNDLSTKNKPEEAFVCFYNALVKAGDNPSNEMLLRLADCYREGKGVKQNYLEAFNLYMSIEKPEDSPQALFQIGRFYLKGLGVPKDIVAGLYFLEESAKQRNIHAIHELHGFYLANGEYQNLERAQKLYDRARALGMPILKHEFLDKQRMLEESEDFWRQAAEQGVEGAQLFLGIRLHAQGRYEEARKFFRQAAKQGNADAQYNLGIMYEKGRGGDNDDYKAVKWLTQAARQGYALAQHCLGIMYESGRGGLDKDDRKAFKLYAQAAGQGLNLARYNLGYMYETGGGGVDKDGRKAFELYTQAAEQGVAEAQCNLGNIYWRGSSYGIERDVLKAIDLYTKSAKQGNPVAQNNLGRIYAALATNTDWIP